MERRQTDKPYSREVIDLKFDEVHGRFDKQDVTLARIEGKQDYTNGKLRKVIMALILLGGMFIGFVGKDSLPILIKLLV